MKIILSAKSVYPFHPTGGVQKYVYYFAKHLAEQGVELEIVAPLDKGRPRTETYDGLKYTFLKPAIYRYLEYPVGWLGVHLFSRSLSRYLQNAAFDVLHSFDLTGYQYVKQRRRRPVIAHIFTDNYLCNPIASKHFLNLFNVRTSQLDRIKERKVTISPFADRRTKSKYAIQYLLKIRPMYRCLTQAEAVFFEAEEYQREVNALYRLDPRKTAVVPVGTDVAMIEHTLRSGGLSRKELGFDDQDIVLMTVNRLAADKGVDQIVLALADIVKMNPRVKLIIVGSGYQEKEIVALIENKGLRNHVRHFKNVAEDRLYPYYHAADLYISAFSYPGSSISTLEAMACGLPVITTAQPWLVREGQNGIVLKDNAAASIARAVKDMIAQGQLKEQGGVSRDIVREYDWDRIAAQAIARYEHILGKKAVPL